MKDFFASIFSSSRDGLPYWIFWFLLCIILLLLIFIFLRDKELRQRLNSFLVRIKRQLIKIRLKSRLKKEQHEKTRLLITLGKKVWNENIFDDKGSETREKLEKLEKEKQSLEKELENINSRIDSLKVNLEESRQEYQDQLKEKEASKTPYEEKLAKIKEKEKIINVTTDKNQKIAAAAEKELKRVEKKTQEIEIDAKLSEDEKNAKKEKIGEQKKNQTHKKEEAEKKLLDLKEEKEEIKKERKELQEMLNFHEKSKKEIEEKVKEKRNKFQKEIKAWEKNKVRIHEKMKDIDIEKEPLFKKLGITIEEYRSEHEELVIFYSQIDRMDKRIQELASQIQSL